MAMLRERPQLLSHLRAMELFNAPPGAVVRIAPFANVILYLVHPARGALSVIACSGHTEPQNLRLHTSASCGTHAPPVPTSAFSAALHMASCSHKCMSGG